MKIAIFGIFFNFWKKNPKNRQICEISNELKTSNFYYFWTLETAFKSWKAILYNFWKKKFFQALAKNIFEKKNSKFLLQPKKWFFWKINFCRKKQLKVDISTFNAKKWIRWVILRNFCAEKIFHRTFSFCCRSLWKLPFLAYFSIDFFCQKLKNRQKIEIFKPF